MPFNSIPSLEHSHAVAECEKNSKQHNAEACYSNADSKAHRQKQIIRKKDQKLFQFSAKKWEETCKLIAE